MATRWLIGLAPGSSLDGVDAALVEIQGAGLELRVRPLQLVHQPYPRDLRSLVMRATALGPFEIQQASLLHRLLGETFAVAARLVADRASFSLQQVMCIGCPGQNVWQETDGRYPSALELGMAAIVAERTGVTTIGDFLARDLAAGGQGVPLHALADYLLFGAQSESRLLIHLGGVANVVFWPAKARIADVIAFEAGPCNLVLDGVVRALTGGRELFDAGGKHAVQGRCIEPLLERWLAHPYWQRRPPKCLSSQAFVAEFVAQALQAAKQTNASVQDILCTATHLVARGLVFGLRRFLPAERVPDRVLLSGGGVRNGLLWHLLEQQLAGPQLAKTDTVQVPVDARKALTFAILAGLTVDGVPANVPSATGAAGARLLGSLTPGSASNWGRCVGWMASQLSPMLSARAS